MTIVKIIQISNLTIADASFDIETDWENVISRF